MPRGELMTSGMISRQVLVNSYMYLGEQLDHKTHWRELWGSQDLPM